MAPENSFIAFAQQMEVLSCQVSTSLLRRQAQWFQGTQVTPILGCVHCRDISDKEGIHLGIQENKLCRYYLPVDGFTKELLNPSVSMKACSL